MNRITIVVEPDEYSKLIIGLIEYGLDPEIHRTDEKLSGRGIDNTGVNLKNVEICFINKNTMPKPSF